MRECNCADKDLTTREIPTETVDFSQCPECAKVSATNDINDLRISTVKISITRCHFL